MSLFTPVPTFLDVARQDLADLLDDYRVYQYRPEAISPTCIAVSTEGPMLTPASTWADWNVSFVLECFIATGVNASAVAQGDRLAVDVIEKLRGSWLVQSVTPDMRDVSDFQFYVLDIAITSQYSINN